MGWVTDDFIGDHGDSAPGEPCRPGALARECRAAHFTMEAQHHSGGLVKRRVGNPPVVSHKYGIDGLPSGKQTVCY